MAPSRTKCCVIGCNSTKHTQRLFCMPSNDHLRNLWMSFLVPTSPYLLGLSKDQLMTKRVCRKHFDETQFDQMGVRIRHSYPCLFTENEFIHGVPLSSEEYNVLNEHNYCDNSNSEDDTTSGEPTILTGMPDDVHPREHLYTLPPTCQAAISKQSENGESEENQFSFSAAFQAPTTSAVQNEGTSISRRSLVDISQQENIETKLLQSSQPSTSKDTVNVAGHDLFIFHDPPHLLKSVRNNFLDKDVVFDGKRASWEDILYVYDLDIKAGHTRALPKLTADHVDPKRIKKMKVKMAAQVFSARTAAMLNYTDTLHKRLKTPKETMGATAALVLFFDELFDSVNGSPGQVRGKLRCAIKNNSPHIEFWKMAVKKIKDMKFIDTKSTLARRVGQPRLVRVPCLDGWITTINSFLGLTRLLFSEYQMEYFYPRMINQDPLENFFGRIRALNYRNVNPNSNTFMNSFKSLVISNVLAPQSKAMNCEDDDGETLIDLSFLFAPPDGDKENLLPEVNMNMPSSSSLIPVRKDNQITKELAIAEKIKVHISAYTAGYVCRKITNKIGCNSCSKTYTTKEHQGIHEYIQHREYKRLKQDNLKYPTAKILCLYRECTQIVHNYLNTECHKNGVKKFMKNIINERCDMSWLGCKNHKTPVREYFVSLLIRLQVHNWCNIINKILNGKIEEKYILKMHPLHTIAFKKYKGHKLKQKATKVKN